MAPLLVRLADPSEGARTKIETLNHLQEPGRYLDIVATPGAHLKPPTCVGMLPTVRAVPVAFVGVSVIVPPEAPLRSLLVASVTVITPLPSVATELTYLLDWVEVSQPHPPAPGAVPLAAVW